MRLRSVPNVSVTVLRGPIAKSSWSALFAREPDSRTLDRDNCFEKAKFNANLMGRHSGVLIDVGIFRRSAFLAERINVVCRSLFYWWGFLYGGVLLNGGARDRR